MSRLSPSERPSAAYLLAVGAFRAPGGESGLELIARVQSFHRDIARANQDCVVIAHGGPLKLLIKLLGGEPIDLLAPPPALGTITCLSAG